VRSLLGIFSQIILFVNILYGTLRGTPSRCCNNERPVVFLASGSDVGSLRNGYRITGSGKDSAGRQKNTAKR
jgi:hypothetical protein